MKTKQHQSRDKAQQQRLAALSLLNEKQFLAAERILVELSAGRHSEIVDFNMLADIYRSTGRPTKSIKIDFDSGFWHLGLFSIDSSLLCLELISKLNFDPLRYQSKKIIGKH